MFSSLSFTLAVTCRDKMPDSVIVDTEYGKVKGVKKISALNSAYSAFLGIPYATPPTGELRFKVSKS